MANDYVGVQQFEAGDYSGFIAALRSASASLRSRTIGEFLALAADKFEWDNGASDADLLYDLAAALWVDNEPLALSVFREAALLGSDEAFAALGDAFNWMGDDTEAITWLRAALERGSGDRDWLEGLLGESLLRTGASPTHEIEQYLNQGLKSSARFALPLALILINKGKIEDARDILERATQSGQYGAALALGNLLCDQYGDHAGAEQAYKLGIETGDAYSAHNLAVMLLGDGERKRAEVFHKIAIDMGDPSPL